MKPTLPHYGQWYMEAGKVGGTMAGCLIAIIALCWCISNRREFWQQIFSDVVGGPSVSSIAMAVLLYFCVVWDTRYVFITRSLPDALTMAGQAAFFSSPYGIKKAANVLMKPAAPAPPVTNVTNAPTADVVVTGK